MKTLKLNTKDRAEAIAIGIRWGYYGSKANQPEVEHEVGQSVIVRSRLSHSCCGTCHHGLILLFYIKDTRAGPEPFGSDADYFRQVSS